MSYYNNYGYDLAHKCGQLSETKGKSFSYLINKKMCMPVQNKAVVSGNAHVYPVDECRPIKIAVNNVLDVPGITNALFLVGSTTANEDELKYCDINIAVSDNAINCCEDNRQAFLLVKEGSAHTLAFSTGAVPSFLYEQKHLFEGRGALGVVASHFGDFAGQDFAAEGIGGEENDCKYKHDDTIAIVKFRPNINAGDRTTTFEVRMYDRKHDCHTEYMYSEFWYVIPLDDEFGNYITGRDIRERDTDRRNRRENTMILARGTNTGAIVLAGIPNKRFYNDGYVYYGNSGKARNANRYW